jgi:hypothetical protein
MILAVIRGEYKLGWFQRGGATAKVCSSRLWADTGQGGGRGTARPGADGL